MTRRLALVTGASGGIGEAIARRLAADDMVVIALARRAEKLRTLAAEIDGAAYAVDLSDPDATTAVCQQILEEHGTPDVIINNAGAGRFISIEETSNEEARQQLELPYLAAFHVTRGFIEPMLRRGSGTIFQINSPVAVVPWPGAVGYAASRFALRGFTEALRQDLWTTGIRVGSLTPARVHSEYFDANPGSVERVPRVEALVGTMTPEGVADAVAVSLRHRAHRDSFVPWRWALIAPWARVFPGVVAWLFRATGHRRLHQKKDTEGRHRG
ncbi:MAG: SDR family NAD(P)-dependent oxidoreductase [Propionibacteriaceae bacterium]|nr:SDR family NAD(P)-dependent oxidoreductase [Propionibacteriaceae bacterium]